MPPHLLPVVHPIGGLIVWVDWVLVANLIGPFPLLVHVSPAHQLGPKGPALAPGQLHIHGYVVIGLLQLEEREVGLVKNKDTQYSSHAPVIESSMFQLGNLLQFAKRAICIFEPANDLER